MKQVDTYMIFGNFEQKDLLVTAFLIIKNTKGEADKKV